MRLQISAHDDRGGRAEGLACTDTGARTPMSSSGIVDFVVLYVNKLQLLNINRYEEQ